jgi:GLPGLI family protein
MKKIIVLLLCLPLLLGSDALFAQKKPNFDEGTIVYGLNMDGGEAQMAMIAGMVNMSMSFKGAKNKLNISLMNGALGSLQIVSPGDGKGGFMLYDVPMAQERALVRMDSSAMSNMPTEEGAKTPGNPAELFNGADIKYVKGSKKIAGYKCKKAEMSFLGQSATIFYTEKLRPAALPQGFGNLKGFPLEIQLNLMGMQINFAAKEVKKGGVAPTEFEKPSGYEEITMEEFMKKAQEMGKGGGIGM